MFSLHQWWVPIWHCKCQIYCQIAHWHFQINKMIHFVLFFIIFICELVTTYCLKNKMSILFCLLKLISDILCITIIICLLSIRNLNYLATVEYIGYIYQGCALGYLNGANVIIGWTKNVLPQLTKAFEKIQRS